MNSAEAKLRTLASVDPTMVADFGSGPFRWFQIQAPQGYIAKGSCVRVRRVSAVYLYAQEGITQAEQVRLQFDVLDKSQDRARDLLNDLCSFIAGVDLMSGAQFTSQPGTNADNITERGGWRINDPLDHSGHFFRIPFIVADVPPYELL